MKMIRIRRGRATGRQRGQATIETAIGIPLMLTLAFNVINIGYFWFMVLALAAGPRHANQYASQGGDASTGSQPLSAAVATVLTENVTNAVVGATTSNISYQVCIQTNGVSSTTHKATCNTSGSYTFVAADADPEDTSATVFVLQKVDVAYTVQPLIPGSAFNVLVPANLTFHRQVTMRNLWF